MFLLGLADDLWDMDPQHKLVGQIIIAAVVVFLGLQLEWTGSTSFNLFLSMVWIVGITNAFNLLDNMDGLSAGIAFIGGIFLFVFICTNPECMAAAGPVLMILAAYLGAMLGFLLYNFSPASIFMGDAGSLFIGFMLACLSVVGSPEHIRGGGFLNLVSVMSIPILIVFIPILDTGFVSVMRKLFGRRISQGGKDHSSHRMVAIGLSEKKAVLVLYAFAVASGLIALGVQFFSAWASVILVVFYLLFVLFFWIYLGNVKVYSEPSVLAAEGKGLTPILIEITYRRRLLEVVLDSILITVAYYTAYFLRFEGAIGGDFQRFLKSLPVLIACQLLCFFVFGIYRGVWARTSVSDLIVYLKAITAGTILTVLILLGLYRFQGFSRAVFAIYWVFMLILVSASRLSFRLLDEALKKGNGKGDPTLVYGAGVGGQMAMREIETNPNLNLRLVGFIDDDPDIESKRIQGYPVLGGQGDLERLIRKHHIKRIIISFKENGLEKKHELQDLCRKMDQSVEVNQMKLIID
jgi:UDP-GlcNAc:undecaprenyl-phosphate GlcNAc-1-phosphate transferase